MALVRCSKHGIPYNDDNPRGCPACALEQTGGEQARVMRELARASQAARRPRALDLAPPPDPRPPRGAERPTAPVTTPPRTPVPEPGWLDRLRAAVRRQPVPVVGLPLSVILLGLLLFRSGPTFVDQPSPVPITGPALPLPIEPGAPVTTVFAVLGVQPPQPNPEHSELARYSYGTDLTIDALNGSVYLITLLVPNRTWHGLQVGVPEQQALGALALLGQPQQAAAPTAPRADTLRGLVAYPSLAQRPTRSVEAQVRPPNGCYDVIVDIQPRAAGVLIDGARRWAVLGPLRAQPEWVATSVRIINRALAGPGGPAACGEPTTDNR
jgi:hypothetical protein